MPDYPNAYASAAERKMGPFVFDQRQNEGSHLVQKNPFQFQNGMVYWGQWNRDTGHREGQGTQIWKDGSKFTGEWDQDQVGGKGRLIHQDGDVYEGTWLNNKAHGRGTYSKINGYQYIGEWRDDH